LDILHDEEKEWGDGNAFTPIEEPRAEHAKSADGKAMEKPRTIIPIQTKCKIT
jgi:hypothetical protein